MNRIIYKNMKTYSRKQILQQDVDIDFDKVCRFCLSKDTDMYYIYQESLFLPTRIKACLDLDVIPYDGLPSNICEECLGHIEKAYSFRELCLKVDHTLRQKLLENRGGECESRIKIISIDANLADSSRKTKVQIPEVHFTEFDEAESLSISPLEDNINEIETFPSSHIKESNKNKENNPMQELQYGIAALPFHCSKCPKKFERRMDLKRHESIHNTKKGYDCELCEKWFPNKNSFERHKRIHTGEKPYACQYCGKTFSQSAILQRHFLVHTGVKPFHCEECNKGFTQRVNLRAHVRKYHHSDERKNVHKCPLCNKSFCHPSGLSRHLIRHTGRLYRCHICKKPFTDQSSVKRHIKRHEDPPSPDGKLDTIENSDTFDHFPVVNKLEIEGH